MEIKKSEELINIEALCGYIEVVVKGRKSDLSYLIGKEIARYLGADETGQINICINFLDDDGEIKPIKELFKKNGGEKPMKITFKAKILAEVRDTPENIKGRVSITSIMAKLARGEMEVSLPTFIDEPTIILKEKNVQR